MKSKAMSEEFSLIEEFDSVPDTNSCKSELYSLLGQSNSISKSSVYPKIPPSIQYPVPNGIGNHGRCIYMNV